MKIERIKLQNWKNFKKVNAPLSNRTFIVGPNASGKSNFLDAFRFLRDIGNGHLQDAVKNRGGFSQLVSRSSGKNDHISIELKITDNHDKWTYVLKIGLPKGKDVYIAGETVVKNHQVIIQRPDENDRADKVRLTQTYLEQVSANVGFRDIANYFKSFNYLHIIPQMVRHPEAFNGAVFPEAYGQHFLEVIANTPERTRKEMLRQIENALMAAIPLLKELRFVTDKSGRPHMELLYNHWKAQAAPQREDQFSDGTLRLIGMLWALLESDSLLLFEEPEMSLNPGIVEKLPAIMHRALKHKNMQQQILVSTHSPDLLLDRSIGGEEVLLLFPAKEETKIISAGEDTQIRSLLEGGIPAADAVMPVIRPENIYQMDLFQ